jgi:predicted unusual protein kinase regulating ubiquinone biosynthesis (AarF/ABC1/UbiB family)
MSDDEPSLRARVRAQLLTGASDIPGSSLGRLGRTAWAAMRGARLLRRRRGAPRPPDEASLAALVGSIGKLKGVAMKMGQIMSYIDVALPDELREALAVLQTHSQPMPFEQVTAILTTELGDDAPALLAELEPAPVAAASIGQVHRGRLPDGTAVAVKVRYPGIDEAIASDFRPAAIGTRLAALFYPGADVAPLIAEARARFLEECDYLREARSQERFGALFGDHPVLVVPAVHRRYVSSRVLTTTWIDGLGFDDYLASAPSAGERDRMGVALFTFYVGTLFRHRLYNCDPHPGNYLLLPGGRIAMLDYGCTREFEPDFVARLAALTRAVHADEHEALHQAFVALGMVRQGEPYDFDTARSLVRAFYGPMLRDEERAIELGEARPMGSILASKRELMKLHLPGEFLFLFRIRFGLMSVLARLGARANWYRLERGWLDPTGAG